MSTFSRATPDVAELAQQLITDHHQPLAEAGVTIDYVFAHGDRNDEGELTGHALTKNSLPALGIARKLPLKDRAMGRADAEIALDADWWGAASEEEQLALLDHELTHLKVTDDVDNLGRPKLKLRPHDHEFGWFNTIAQRHGVHSQERKQSHILMDMSGQFYWPNLDPSAESSSDSTVEISSGGLTTGKISHATFSKTVKSLVVA